MSISIWILNRPKYSFRLPLCIVMVLLIFLTACEPEVRDKITHQLDEKGESPAPRQVHANGSKLRPNIFLLVLEDMSPKVGAYGDPVAVTPNLDRFARESVLFERAFTTAGVCAPSRSSLITGVHQQTLGTMHMRTSAFGVMTNEGHPYEAVIPAHIKAFPELLRRAGYTTLNDDKTDYQFGNPFTVWDINAKGAAWESDLKALSANKPLFAMVNFFTTHESYTWPPDDTVEHEYAESTRARNRQFDQTKTAFTDPRTVSVPPYYPNEPAVAENIARHYDNIAVTDKRVRDFLAKLEVEGLLDNSIVIITADHGDGLPRAKRTVYDSGIAVPLLVRFPNRQYASTVREDLVSFVDLAPTILSLAQVEVPTWMQGRVFLGAHTQNAPDTIFAAADRNGQSAGRVKAARSKKYKYIRNYQADGPRLPYVAYQDVNPIMQRLRSLYTADQLSSTAAQFLDAPSPAEELYDLEQDPHEVSNLAGNRAHQSALVELRSKMDAWIDQTGDMSAQSEQAMVAHMWPNGQQPTTQAVIACRQDDNAIVLSSPTSYASVGYRLMSAIMSWSLYKQPIKLEESSATLEVKAIRYGFAESEVSRFDIVDLPRCR